MHYEKATIHKVCCLFHNFFWAEIFCPKSQKVVLEVANNMKKEEHR